MIEHKEYKELVEDHRQTLQNTNEELKTRIKLMEGNLEVGSVNFFFEI